jgi:chemotaxis protein CheD
MFRGLSASGIGAIGERNAEAVRRTLTHLDIPLAGEDIGGTWGRTVYVQARDGAYIVSNVLRDDVVL